VVDDFRLGHAVAHRRSVVVAGDGHEPAAGVRDDRSEGVEHRLCDEITAVTDERGLADGLASPALKSVRFAAVRVGENDDHRVRFAGVG